MHGEIPKPPLEDENGEEPAGSGPGQENGAEGPVYGPEPAPKPQPPPAKSIEEQREEFQRESEKKDPRDHKGVRRHTIRPHYDPPRHFG